MKRIFCTVALVLLASLSTFAATPAPQTPQEKKSSRDETRDKLAKLLETGGARSDVNVTFRQSTKQPYNYVGVMSTGLANCDSIEIVIGVSTDETIGFRLYPHYNGAYINVDKAKNGAGLMRKLLNLSDHNFLFYGADDGGDVFAGYTFTLESGFPADAIIVVLRSIRNIDQYVGEMRPMIDGTFAPAK